MSRSTDRPSSFAKEVLKAGEDLIRDGKHRPEQAFKDPNLRTEEEKKARERGKETKVGLEERQLESPKFEKFETNTTYGNQHETKPAVLDKITSLSQFQHLEETVDWEVTYTLKEAVLYGEKGIPFRKDIKSPTRRQLLRI